MTALTHALGARGAHIRDAFGRFLRGAGEVLATFDAAVRISGAIERHQQPSPADLKTLGIKPPLPRLY